MYCEHPVFEPAENHLVVWVGTLDTEQLEGYLNEPGDADDTEPISRFAQDLGRWYDHDHIWAQATEEVCCLKELAEANGIDDELLIEELTANANERSAGAVSCLIILWNAKLLDKPMRPFAEGRLVCLGSWAHASPLAD